MTAAMARPTRAATWATSPAIAAASALASSMWAYASPLPASKVAPIWARSPGGGPPSGLGLDAFGSSRIVLRFGSGQARAAGWASG
jgi:hypothetical protein